MIELSESVTCGLVPNILFSSTSLTPSLSESAGASALSNGSVPERSSSRLVNPSPSKSSWPSPIEFPLSSVPAVFELSESELFGSVPNRFTSSTSLIPSLSVSVGVSVLSSGSLPARISSRLVNPSPSKSSCPSPTEFPLSSVPAVFELSESALLGSVPSSVNSSTSEIPSPSVSAGKSVLSNGSLPARTSSRLE